MIMLNYTTVVSVEIKHMSEFITPRKRKSETTLNEPNSKKTQESSKPESASKKLIRRLSTKLRIFTPTKVAKSRYQAGENIFIEESESNEVNITISDGPESSVHSSMTFFSAPYLKKGTFEDDMLSNNSDTLHQSSTITQHLRIGIDLFNRNSNCGIEYLREKGATNSDEELAELFIKKKGFSKIKLFEFLTSKENRSIHRCFCNQLDLKFKTIPEVLKEYLKYSYIAGEYNTMLDIVDVLSHAYIEQHDDRGVMGLNVEQIITIFQYLITFTANEQKEKISANRISRETFIEYLQTSLTDENKISRQLASCLHWEICESPPVPTMDERLKNLENISKLLTDIPKEFALIQHHRYVICHVDLSEVRLNGTEKPSYHDRTLFLFNDALIVTKKKWLSDSNSYRVKQIIELNKVKVTMVTRSPSSSNPIRMVQIIDTNTTDILINFHSKLCDDLMSFFTSLDHSVASHRTMLEFCRHYESRPRS